MNTLTKEEYLALLQKLIEEQYNNEDPYGNHDFIIEMEKTPSDSDYKRKHHVINKDGSIDLTFVKKDKVKQVLADYKYANLKVGDFLIRITFYKGEPREPNATINVALYQTVYKTPSGAPCNMLNKFYIHKDSRFENRPWLSYFSTYNGQGVDIPIDTLTDIIRWMQAVKKLTAFL